MSSLIPTKPSIWQQMILKQKSSGLSGVRWCECNHVQYNTFCYWKRRLSKVSLSRTSFIEVQDKDSPIGVQLECQGIKVLLKKDFDAPTLLRVLTILKGK